jgi:hypothetical protein
VDGATLAADPLPYGGHRVLKGILALVDRKREQLQPAAFTLGRQVYEASPEAFTSRMAEYWNAGTQGTEAAKPPARARLARGRSRVVSRGLGTK